MKHSSRFLFFCLCILCCTAGVVQASREKEHSGEITFTKHFQQSLFAVTEKGEFSVEILLNDREYKIGKNVIGIVIHNKHDEDVEAADIKVLSGDQGLAVVTDKGGGLYTVGGLDIGREDTWELKVQVRTKGIEDSAVFLFPYVMQKSLSAGRYLSEDPRFKVR